MNSLKRIFQVLSVLALAPVCAGAQSFAYVANKASNTVSAYRIDPTTGTLTEVPGSPFPARGLPNSVTVDPAGKFAYVANIESSVVSAYAIDPTTGALTEVPGSPFPAGANVLSVIADPRGKFVYAANPNSNNVSAYTIDPATGALTAVPGSPFPAASMPGSVTVDPTGKFAYVANWSYGISAYTINAATGALTEVPGSPYAGGGGAFSNITVDPTGKFVCVANWLGSSVSVYTIHPTTGALSAVPGSPFPAGLMANSVTVDPAGKFVYVGNYGDNTVSAYTIDPATGSLTAVAGSPFASGGFRPSSVAGDPTGRFVYVTSEHKASIGGAGNVSAYTINRATGALTTVPGSPFPAGFQPDSIVTTAVQRDDTPPTTTATVLPGSNSYGWNNTDVTISFSATDNPGGSGVKEIQFALSGVMNTGWQTVAGDTASLAISAEGTTILSYLATDHAGNREAAKTLTVRIDKTPPVISGLPVVGCTIWPPDHKLVQIATVTATDALSTLALGSFTITGTSSGPSRGQIVITGGLNQFIVQLGADKDVTYALTATASDLAGNVSTKQAICTVPHDQGK